MWYISRFTIVYRWLETVTMSIGYTDTSHTNLWIRIIGIFSIDFENICTVVKLIKRRHNLVKKSAGPPNYGPFVEQ